MADSVNIEDFAFNFEAEHIFADSLFGSDAVGNFLREMGYAKNALGNLMLEFADADTVAKIQDLPADHPLRVALSDAESGAGIVRHKGNASGGSQFGKNAFLRDAIDEIRTSGASSEAQRIALDNLFDWTRKLAKGEILDADGKPLGVMGNTEFAQVLDNAYRNGTGPNGSPKQYVDPVDIANGGNLPPEQQAEVARARQISTEVREYWEKPENSQVFSSDANKPDFDPLNDEGKFNGRGALAQKYAETLNRAGLISDESYNLALEELGSGKNSSAASRVVIRLTGEAAAQSKVLVTGDDPSYTKKVVSEYRAVAQASEIAPEATDDSRVLEEYENVSKQVAQEELNSGVLRGSFAEYGKGVKGIVARAATGITSSRLASGRAVGIGLIIAGADVLHDSFKKGLTEGDWSDFIIEGTKFGAVTVGSIAGLTILGGIAATIGGAVAAEVVVAGAIVVGAVGAAYALGDLIHKLAVDVGLAEAPIQQGAVPNNIQENINFITNVGEKVLLNDFLGKLGAPVLPFYNQKFIADDQDLHFADVVYGDDDKAELVYADNGAIVDTGGGADEVYHFGYGQVFGGAGQDVLVGKDAKVLHQGEDLYKWMNVLADQRDALNAKYQALNVERAQNGEPLFKILPSLPRSPQASEDIVLRLDGGTDNDIVFALGGERAITAGGLGRDWIYNTSSGGEIWGDVQGSVNLGGGHYAYFENGQQVDIADGHDNSDNFWYAPDVTIMDAQHSDVLKFYGLPLTGGDANGGLMGLGIGGLAGSAIGLANAMQGNLSDWTKGVYFDHLFPWMTYQFQRNADGNLDLYITNQFDQIFRAFFSIPGFTDAPSDGPLHGYMKVANVDVIGSRLGSLQFGLEDQGSLGMVFRAVNPLQMLLPILTMVPGAIGAVLYYSVYADTLASTAAAIGRAAKAAKWSSGGDPLVIDLDGDGIETISLDASSTYFDVDGDLFRERTGWLKGDDGFLVLDANGNGRVDGISEMFGNRFQGGYDELATCDSNGDGKITTADAVWASLQVWQDKNRDGVTQDGELKTLDQLGITELSLTRNPLSATTSAGANLQAYGSITFSGGRVSTMFEAIFTSNDVDTKYAGDDGLADWQAGSTLDAKGFGRITDLSVATANDVDLGVLAAQTATGMTSYDLRTLVNQAGAVLGKWGETLEQTRELAPVLVGHDASGKAVLLDRGVYVEDAQGGYWTLASGNPVLDATGAPIARASLEQILAQAAGGGAAWRIEQMWSPSDRSAALHFREAAPYLMQLVDGRAVVLDYGIRQADGTWKLASDPATTYATKADILALAHTTGTEWRSEEIGFNPYAALPVDRIGVRFTDGQVVDYTVQVTDQDGTFYVWARNLDRAIQLEWKTGDSREFVLRNYAIDFDHLDETVASDNSTYRVEMLTPAQFHFATSLGSGPIDMGGAI